MTLTYDAGATSTMEVASGRAAYMARQTVQNLGVRQPNTALAQYYADSVDQKQASTPEPQPDEAPKLDRVARSHDRSKRTLDELDAALRANMGGLAEALLGKPTRKTPNEMRWGSKGAFQVSLRGPSRGAWKDHESGEGGGPLGLIVRARGGTMRDAIEWGYKWAGIDPNAPEPIVQIQRPTKADQGAEAEAYRLHRMALAQRMWKESVPIQGTTAERYLVETRGVPKQLFGWPASYRYHPQSNALIVGLTDVAGEVRAVQRVMLDQEGKKATVEVQKPTTGRMEGLAVRLAGDPKGLLVIAEGPETGISVWAATGYETLVAGSGSWRMSDLPTDRRVVIARDDDPVGSPAWTAILRASREWKANGIDVHFVRPWQHSRGDKSDFNDLLKHGGVGAVRARFNPDNVVRMDAADMPQRGAVLRPDTHPKLLRLLEINQKFALSETEIAHLMNATTITGRDIEGKTYSVYREKLSDGTEHKVPLGYIDLTWSAHKSVSLAWAFAVSDHQRDTILRAWRDAVATSMIYAENVLGVVAKGHGGRDGYDQGHVTWVSFDHYTARPTVDIVEVAADGSKHTDSVKVNLPGDPNLHTHAIMPNVVLADNGRVGSLDGNRLDGKVKQLGAYLQAQLATNLRKYGGVEVDVDPDTFSARITAIPSLANTTFSKRTNKSEVVAKEFAAAHGLDWSTMTPEARTNLVHKSAGITKQRNAADAKIDFDSWHAQADAIHWRPSNVLRPGQEIGVPELAARIEGAYTASLPWLDAAFRHRAVLTEDEVRTIATRGLIVTGITDWRDVDRVTKLYRERGVLHNEKPTNLVWAPNPENQWRMAITTELHEAEENELIGLVRAAAADTRGSNRTNPRQLKEFADTSGLDFTTPEGKEQYAAAAKLASGGKFSLVIGVPGSGKALPVDAKVLTPAGFVAIGSLMVGDSVTCPDGRRALVSGVFPQGNKQLYRVSFEDGRQVECCVDHLWKVWSHYSVYVKGRGAKAPKKSMKGWRIANLATIMGWFDRGTYRAMLAAVPVVSPSSIEMPPQNLPIPPYVLGALLGDGSLTSTTGFTTADPIILDRLLEQMPEYEATKNGLYGHRIRMKHRDIHACAALPRGRAAVALANMPQYGQRRERVITHAGRPQPLAEWAREVGLPRALVFDRLCRQGWTVPQALGFSPSPKISRTYSPIRKALAALGLESSRSATKFIPDIYKKGSVADRLALLQGLMDTDGSVGNGTHGSFTSTSQKLAADVQEIAWSLGAIAKIAPRQTYCTYKGARIAGKPSWRVSIVHPHISQFFSLPRKTELCRDSTFIQRLHITKIEEGRIAEAVCIAVDHPDGLYVTDNYIVTHNSSVLKPLVNSWNADGKNVVGLALAWRQTEQLDSAGIKYRKAIDAFLRKPDSANLSPNTVVVIDEIGQVCTHQLLQIARLQKQIGFSVVALGDPKQCQSIEAGPVIDLLRRALGEANVPTLLKIIRQLTDREKTISKLFRDGDAATAIQMKREDNTARNIPGSYADVVKHVANLWAELTVANKATKDYRLTVMAPTNGEAHDISGAIREKRREWGEIGPDLKVIQASDQRGKVRYDLPIAAGDKVRLFERTNASFVTGGHGNIGHNGSVLTVVGASDEDITLKDRDGREGRVKWSTLKETGVIRLAYGDALTIDAGQGMTGTEHIDAMVGGSSAVSAFKATVTESRHRVRSHMIVSDVAERRQIIGRRPTGDPRPITEEDVWANVARNLSRAPAQEAATAMIARLHEVRRSTAHVVQATQTLERLHPGRWPKMQIRNALARAATMVQTVLHRQVRSQSL